MKSSYLCMTKCPDLPVCLYIVTIRELPSVLMLFLSFNQLEVKKFTEVTFPLG